VPGVGVREADGGHEFPFYPSFYPQEITFTALDATGARAGLEKGLHAYLGRDPFGTRAVPTPGRVAFADSLGSYLVVTFNRASAAAGDPAGRCAAAAALGRALDGKSGWVIHPYPITPYHADYLYHFDRVEDRQRLQNAGGGAVASLKFRAKGRSAQGLLLAAGLRLAEVDWDAAVEEIDLDDLLARHRVPWTGLIGPAWIKDGWFHAYLLHSEPLGDGSARRAADELVQRRLTGGVTNIVERLHLERELVRRLTLTCERVVLGYGVRRQAYNVEYSEGIENVAYDSLSGLGSAIFIRTAKLKDFPWNGWMQLGLTTKPAAAWNPVAGFTDRAGRALWSAVGDPAFLPAPYAAGWVSNRVTASVTPGAAIPADAVVPDAAHGGLTPAPPGEALKVSYKVLLSAFHDGTRMGMADILYPYVFAARWSGARSLATTGAPQRARGRASGRADVRHFDADVDRVSAVSRDWVAGIHALRVDKDLKDFGEVKLFWDSAYVDVYLRHPIDDARAAAVAPPWSTVPWHVLVLMEEAVTRGMAAFSEAEARRRGVPWLDLVRDPTLKTALAALATRLEQRAYVPESLQTLVSPEEARARWAALRRFYRERRHFLVTNGPYRLDRWSADGAVLQVFRDLTYPLTVGTFDRFALPRRAYVSAVEQEGARLLISADVDRIAKSQRDYSITRTPLGGQTLAGQTDAGTLAAEVPVCHWVVLGAGGEIVATGSSRQLAGTDEELSTTGQPPRGIAQESPATAQQPAPSEQGPRGAAQAPLGTARPPGTAAPGTAGPAGTAHPPATAQRPENHRLVVDLTDRLPPGAYRVLVALVLDDNFAGAEVTSTSYVVAPR
jgi:hypothetical protein